MSSGAKQATSPLLAALAAVAAAICPQPSAAAPACLPAEASADAVGAAVPDSRTIVLADGAALRLAGIEPIALLAGGAAAEAALRERIAALAIGAPLRFAATAEGEDRYGRLSALVAAEGALVQATLAREGLAIAFAAGDPLPCFADILAAEAQARRERRGFWAEAPPLPPPFPDALRRRIGRFAIFEGVVRSVGNRRDRTYLNFGGRWSEDVTVEIAAGDRERFGGEAALAGLAGQRVRIRGFLAEKSGPMMAVGSPMQIERLDSSAGGNGIAP